jgi:hypothetical protein
MGICRFRIFGFILVIAGLLSGGAIAGELWMHPQDGPHADIRASIDETGVEIGMIINLAFVDEIIEFHRESPDAVDPAEEAALKSGLARFFRDKFTVEIDGVAVEPIVSGFEVIRPGLENLPLFPKSGMRGLLRAKVILSYPAKSLSKSVRFVWTVFPPNLLTDPDADGVYPPMTVQAQLTAEGRVDILSFTVDEPEQTWHGTGKTLEERFEAVPAAVPVETVGLPVLAIGLSVVGLVLLARGIARSGRRGAWIVSGVLVLAAAPALRGVGLVEIGGGRGGLPTEAEALAIFEPLHANIYRAFDYEDREAIYDALARSVSGELLDALYDGIYRSLIMYDEGGAISRVSTVRLMEVEVLSIGFVDDAGTPGFTVRAKWQVDGIVYHYGHSHERTNEYLAEYSVAMTEAGWRITGNRMLSQERLDPETKLKPERPDGEI